MPGKLDRMRPSLIPTLLLLPLVLTGCGTDAAIEIPLGVGLAVGSIAVFHRTPVDMVVSAVSGRDCSVVNLDKGARYCLAREPPPEPPVFCTRSLGVADCWEDGSRLPNRPREIADGPRTLTRDQERGRTRQGFGLW